jgi:hypothetical protein
MGLYHTFIESGRCEFDGDEVSNTPVERSVGAITTVQVCYPMTKIVIYSTSQDIKE